jgi:hypothetical protein
MTQSVEVGVRKFTVYRKTENSPDMAVWDIEACSTRVGDKPIPAPDLLKALEYGTTPQGFRTIVPAEPLLWGNTYRIKASLYVPGEEVVVGAGGSFKPSSP